MELRGGPWEKMASMVLGRLKSSGGRTGGGSEDRGIWGKEGTDADCIQAGLVLLLDVDISSSVFRWSSGELILKEVVTEAGIEVSA